MQINVVDNKNGNLCLIPNLLNNNHTVHEHGGPYNTKSAITDVSSFVSKCSDKGNKNNKGKAIRNKGTNLNKNKNF